MTLIQKVAEGAGPLTATADHASVIDGDASTNGIVVVESGEGLATFNQPGTELVIWERTFPSGFEDWIDGLDASDLPDTRILVQPSDIRDALGPILRECALPSDEMRDVLLDDVEKLVTAFSEITDCDFVDVRLERIEHNACWKFHRDTVDARLITTYRGPATEWVQMADAERAIEEQTEYDGPLERLGYGHVALFKGKHAGRDSGIVHRSPPIEGTGCTRLLLCLNKPTVVSPSPWKRD